MMGSITTQSLLLLVMLQVSGGHGYIFEPASRNMRAFRESNEICPHCLDSDGGGSAVEPGDERDLVGGEDDTDEIAETYVEGQVIQVKTKIMGKQKGFWRLSVCDRRDFTDSCFAEHILKTLNVSPWTDPTGTWTYMQADAQDTVVTTPYKLPTGLTCTHCTMQWMWISGTSCRPSDMDVKYVETYSANLESCVTNYTSPSKIVPEKFWNVVDIRINSASDELSLDDEPESGRVDGIDTTPDEKEDALAISDWVSGGITLVLDGILTGDMSGVMTSASEETEPVAKGTEEVKGDATGGPVARRRKVKSTRGTFSTRRRGRLSVMVQERRRRLRQDAQ